MKRRIWTGVFTAIVGFSTAAGIAQTSSSPQGNSPPSNPSSADRKITVTGCLKAAPPRSAASTMTGAAGTAGAVGTAGTAGATGAVGTTGTTGDTAAAAQEFLLTDAAAAPADSPAAATTEATVATASAARTYRLIANPTALNPLVGKKLELTGTLEDQDDAGRTGEPAAGSAASAMTLRVQSGKIIAASCSQ
jgi:hypothetical protein